MSEAATASDNTSGVQTIAFHVPQSEWEYQWLYPRAGGDLRVRRRKNVPARDH